MHNLIISSGAHFNPSYEFNGIMESATYTLTKDQIDSIIRNATAPILNALDAMDYGCKDPGFRGYENGYGEDAGTSLQEAREELVILVGHIAKPEPVQEEIPFVEHPMPAGF